MRSLLILQKSKGFNEVFSYLPLFFTTHIPLKKICSGYHEFAYYLKLVTIA